MLFQGLPPGEIRKGRTPDTLVTRADGAFNSAYFCSTVPDHRVREWSEPSECISFAALTR